MLLEERSLRRGFFDADYLKQLFADHRRGHRDHGNRIWRLLNLEIWMRVCIDGELPADRMDLATVVPALG